MIKSLFYDVLDVVVGEGIKHVLTRFSISDKLRLTKNLQLMRNSRLRHTEYLGNVAYAYLSSVYYEKYRHSGGVTENLEKVGKLVERTHIGHLASYPLHHFPMYLSLVAQR